MGKFCCGVTYTDQRFLGAVKGPTGEQDTCPRRVDLAYRFGCHTLPSTDPLHFIDDAALCTKCVYCAEQTDKLMVHDPRKHRT